jgi:hypothetical protein
MKMTLALAGVLTFLCSLAPASDKDKKDEKRPDTQPVRVNLTPAQNKALEEIEQQFQRLQEEAQKQAQILSARESGLITAFVMGTKLEGKQYKLVKEKDGYAVEEVIPPAPGPQPPAPQQPAPTPSPSPGADDKHSPGVPTPISSAAPPGPAPTPKKDQQ